MYYFQYMLKFVEGEKEQQNPILQEREKEFSSKICARAVAIQTS